MSDEKKISSEDLKNGITVKTGTKNQCLTLPTIVINLDINPDEASSFDDKYTLYSTDESKLYKKTLIVKDDKIEGDKFITLYYTGIYTDLLYTMEVDPGADGKKYNVFENFSFDKL